MTHSALDKQSCCRVTCQKTDASRPCSPRTYIPSKGKRPEFLSELRMAPKRRDTRPPPPKKKPIPDSFTQPILHVRGHPGASAQPQEEGHGSKLKQGTAG